MASPFPKRLATLLILALPVLMGAVAPQRYTLANYSLELNGVQSRAMASVQGGNAYAEVIAEPTGPDGFEGKHIGKPKYEAFEIQVGLGMPRPFYDWIDSFWRRESRPMSGAILSPDGLSRRDFKDALITEVTLPAMDAASKEPGYLTVKFAPEEVRLTRGKGGGKPAAPPPKAGAQRPWLASGFRLQIDGLDARRVSRIDPITVQQPVAQDGASEARGGRRTPGPLTISNLNVTIPATGADEWIAWHEDFVIQGKNGPGEERNGAISLVAANQTDVLATIRLYNMGIVALREVSADGGAEAVRRYEAELYVERIELEMSGAKQ